MKTIYSVCSPIFEKVVGACNKNEEEHAICTLIFLNIAAKFKIKKLGINTVGYDKDLTMFHSGWPFDKNHSVFTLEQRYNGWPAIWEVCNLYKNALAEHFNCNIKEIDAGSGNSMQAPIPMYVVYNDEGHVQFRSDLITGIYSWSDEKNCYLYDLIKGL